MGEQIKEGQKAVHAAIREFLDDDEIAVTWVLTIEVVGVDGMRYLAHRAGGGIDGTESPMPWVASGLYQASADLARDQLKEQTVYPDEDKGDEDG